MYQRLHIITSFASEIYPVKMFVNKHTEITGFVKKAAYFIKKNMSSLVNNSRILTTTNKTYTYHMLFPLLISTS